MFSVCVVLLFFVLVCRHCFTFYVCAFLWEGGQLNLVALREGNHPDLNSPTNFLIRTGLLERYILPT